MKSAVLICFFVMIFGNLVAQESEIVEFKIDSTNFTGIGIIKIPNTGKDELFKRVKYWIASKYKSGKTVIDLEDKSGDPYTIILKARQTFHLVYIKGINESDEENSYTVLFSIKDGKIKVEVKDWYNFGYDGKNPNGELTTIKPPHGHVTKTWKQVKASAITFTNQLVTSFLVDIAKSPKDLDDF